MIFSCACIIKMLNCSVSIMCKLTFFVNIHTCSTFNECNSLFFYCKIRQKKVLLFYLFFFIIKNIIYYTINHTKVNEWLTLDFIAARWSYYFFMYNYNFVHIWHPWTYVTLRKIAAAAAVVKKLHGFGPKFELGQHEMLDWPIMVRNKYC